jgi:nitrite reductase (NADH) large subunit
VLKKDLAALQDSNDYYLGNIQKDGTYSVVPRMPGGEVTPDGLIAVGQVAKKYGLYTKVTGGQRVDLFGARVEQLPFIWDELIAAGFESGHAYGKSLRTVKSCVGSTWCRYGVGDSVGLAVELENRYKGLRAPQDQVRRVRLHPRVRRSPGQGRGHHRHREGLEPLRVRQRRHEAPPRRTAGRPT